MNRVEILLLERGERSRRLALNSPLRQGSGELVKYFVDFTPWGATAALPVSTPVVKVLDKDGTDVTYGGHVATAVIADGGTLYEVGDILTITESGSSGDATVTVAAVDAGVITSVTLTDVGYNYTAGTKATTGHTADATVTITVTAAELIVKASAVVVDSTEIEFVMTNVAQYGRYVVFIKGTINSLVGEAMCVIYGEL
jgi:hypothetical protein